jgi:hypothetical protein
MRRATSGKLAAERRRCSRPGACARARQPRPAPWRACLASSSGGAGWDALPPYARRAPREACGSRASRKRDSGSGRRAPAARTPRRTRTSPRSSAPQRRRAVDDHWLGTAAATGRGERGLAARASRSTAPEQATRCCFTYSSWLRSTSPGRRRNSPSVRTTAPRPWATRPRRVDALEPRAIAEVEARHGIEGVAVAPLAREVPGPPAPRSSKPGTARPSRIRLHPAPQARDRARASQNVFRLGSSACRSSPPA